MQLMEIEDLGTIVTVWSVRISMICMFCAFSLRLLDRSRDGSGETSARESALIVGARNLWLLGSFFALIHAMAAMIFAHQGSHELAFVDTAAKTKALLGVAIGAGIYFNYAFVVIWLADAMWWIAKPSSYESRNRTWNWLVYGYLSFIAINGTIVFETGTVRWVSVGGLAVLAILFYWPRSR